ncbi:uncharacterized protein UV8b_07711 [Ustilaginoidea virens]|uniref:Glycoside hydrolase n=1 Tax=Ustilaginoidea virens TaxID=1159556 RepID=A0A8E5HXJ1_USTVR|nr:uncharacterized protein UV8b_07711 [Ustilaginoidea virens]QUC23470.1 hypothetical protein UV8b_07711 [Ustilaginoidea virens]
MSTKIIAACLLGAAWAVPCAPSAAPSSSLGSTAPALSARKAANSGHLTPLRAAKRTSAVAAKGTRRHQRGGRVQNPRLASHDAANVRDGVGSGVDSYTTYLGTGSVSEGWPDRSRWVSFENMFDNYKSQMLQSCGWQNPPQPNNSGAELVDIWDGIQRAAAATGVDHRFILAVVMQESHGCVRAPTTNNGVRNPGLMQCHNGRGTCNDNGHTLNPCPSGTIQEMISEGTAGTDAGDGLAGCINRSGRDDVSAFYRASRIYNSGSIASSGLLQDGIATHCYASDIANRLTGADPKGTASQKQRFAKTNHRLKPDRCDLPPGEEQT